jgi:hypothetical protein
MLDPGTSLAIVSLALQVTQGLLSYYELWKDADDDVAEIQRCLLWLANIFTQLGNTLRKPHLHEDIVSIIRITMKSCEDNVKKLQELLRRVEKEGTPQRLRTKFKTLNRKILYIYRNGEIQKVKGFLDELREDLSLAINLLNLCVDYFLLTSPEALNADRLAETRQRLV